MKAWTTLAQKYILRRPWINVRVDKVQLPNGTEIDEFYVLEYPDWVCIVCLSEEEEAVLVRQYRHGVGEASLELPAGVIDEGEMPLAAAQRELLEETGYVSGDWLFLGRVAQDPHRQNNFVYCFAAKNAKKVAEQNLDAQEEMQVIRMGISMLKEKARGGAILHGIHLAALLLAKEWLENKKTRDE